MGVAYFEWAGPNRVSLLILSGLVPMGGLKVWPYHNHKLGVKVMAKALDYIVDPVL